MAYVRAAEREEQIVAATLRVLRATGVAGLTLRAVAAEAGIVLAHCTTCSRPRSASCAR